MSKILIIAYIILNVITFLVYVRRTYGFFQLPALISLVSLGWVVPQLNRIYGVVDNPDTYMSLALVHMILCNLAITLGFEKGRRIPIVNCQPTTFDMSRLKYVVLLFMILGVGSMLLNHGEYKGGKPEGEFVIIAFFGRYMDYALAIILICFYRKLPTPKVFILALLLITALRLDQFVLLARRADAILFVLMLAFFYCLSHKRKQYKRMILFILPLFLVGVYFNNFIAEYRSNAYDGETSAVENLKHIDYDKDSSEDLYGCEINNAIICINARFATGSYDFGLRHYNDIVYAFVPTVITGRAFKNSLMIDTGDQTLINYLSETGATVTGYYESFAAFSFFGCIEFLLIGLLMGWLWGRKEFYVVSMIFYIVSLVGVLEGITHGIHRILTQIVYFAILIYPFLRFCQVNTRAAQYSLRKHKQPQIS